MDYKYYTEQIRAAVKMPELIERYGIKMNREHRIKCPFHDGGDENCQVNDNYLYCHVCHRKEDQIGFVQFYFDASFVGAIKKINEDFSLGLPIGQKPDSRTKEKMEKAHKAYIEAERRKRAEHERLSNEYFDAMDELIATQKIVEQYKPKKGDRTVNQKYLDALPKFEYAKYRLQSAEEELFQYERENR